MTEEMTMTTEEIRVEALSGPWEAVLTNYEGWVVALDDLDDDGPYDMRVSIVRRSAAPVGDQDADGYRRLPGSYASEDHLVEWCDFEERYEVEARWVQAQAMVVGLNREAGASGSSADTTTDRIERMVEEIQQTRNAIGKIHTPVRPVLGATCTGCGESWPCPTIRAMDAALVVNRG